MVLSGSISHLTLTGGGKKDHTHHSFPLVYPHLTIGDGRIIIRGITNGARAGSTKADCWEFRRYEICLSTS